MISHEEIMEDHNNARRDKEWKEKQARLAKNPSECQYLDILRRILDEGVQTPNRTGIDTLTIPHVMFQHDMQTGFPLMTTKKMAFKACRVETEGFIRGITDKKWFQDRGCHIWDEWCNPKALPAGIKPEDKKAAQVGEMDLGPIYGSQWRNFNGAINENPAADQLKSIVDTIHKNPNDRRMVCSAWNPLVLDQQALPPCHVLWNVMVVKDKLHLCWWQRSCDFFLGVPFNIAGYGLLLHLLAKEGGFKEGTLTGFFSNAHLYVNQIDVTKAQIEREPLPYPTIETKNFTNIFDWTYDQTKLVNYKSHEKLSVEVAV